MSSPTPSSQSLQSSARNPRRRQRNSTEDGSSLRQQPQRKRNKINGETFQPISDPQPNGFAHLAANGHTHPALEHEPISRQALDIPHRGKHAGKRLPKDDGSTILTQNANYAVKQLPSLPEQIRLSRKSDYRGTLLPVAGHALALTHTQALIWDYTSTVSSPTTRTFTLPHAARLGEPLPVGSLVPAGTTNEIGLVVVNATSGIITFWESIENVSALNLFEQRRNGIEGRCGTLLSGETIVELVSADHAGFVVTFSSGRTAQLLLRDTQARPAISVTFLRSQRNTTSGGLFGGLMKNVFSGATWLKNVVATRVRPSQVRGCRETIIANEDGTFQFWQLTWSGQTTLQGEINARNAILSAAMAAVSDSSSDNPEVKVVDVAIASSKAEESNALVKPDTVFTESLAVDLLLLVSVLQSGQLTYALVELEIDDGIATARRTIHLRSYVVTPTHKPNWTPRLLLSNLTESAFAVFEKAIVLISLSTVKPSPESQFLMDCDRVPDPFQDTVYIREERHYAVVGAVCEDNNTRNRQSSILVFIQDSGLVRLTASEPGSGAHAIERNLITAKSRIGQAVFFGTMADSPLDLLRQTEHVFPTEEVEAAALEISNEVCSTESPFIPTAASSMDFHLMQRAKVLKDLALHLKTTYSGISRLTRWKLRWNAEKMAAARKVWTLYDARVRDGDANKRLLPRILFMMNSDFKTSVDKEQGERDRVRQWFLKDVGKMENIVAWPGRALPILEKDKEVMNTNALLGLFSDACDITLGALETAFAFRTDNVSLYQLDSDPLDDGVLQTGYKDLPEFWTSIYPLLTVLPSVFKGVRSKLVSVSENDDHKLIEKLAKDAPRLIDVFCRTSEERYKWYSAQSDEKDRSVAPGFRQAYEKERLTMITSFSELGLAMSGLELAEKYRDMEALVSLVRSELTPELIAAANEKREPEKSHLAAIETRIQRYFHDFGDAWVDAFYTYQVSSGLFNLLLDQSLANKAELTRFLRAEPKRAKLSWINDVLGEKDYVAAGKTLVDVAKAQELDLWGKKVELSLAKLALVAGEPRSAIEVGAAKKTTLKALRLVNLQERLYEHLRPSLYAAMDKDAEIQLAMEEFGRHASKGRPKLQQLLERSMDCLVNHIAMTPDQLIDVFTLMDSKPSGLKENDIHGEEFFLALQVLEFAGLDDDQRRHDTLLQIIWRRCLIRDDWKAFDAAVRKSDQDAMDDLESTMLFQTIYAVYTADMWQNSHNIRVLSPTSVLGAGTTAFDLISRFKSAELAEHIAKDMRQEDATVKHLIEHNRLTHWATTTEQWAKERRRREEAAQKEEGVKIKELMDEIRGTDEGLSNGAEGEQGVQSQAETNGA